MREKKTLFHKGEIISLDDFGISRIANDRILKLVDMGGIGRVSVMVYGSINKEDVDSLMRSGVKLDIHLDMDSKIDGDRKLKDGFFKRVVFFVVGYFLGKYQPEKIRASWEDQIRDFKRIFGRNPDGLNSHQHIHFFPPFWKIALGLAKKHDIRYVRSGKRGARKPNLVSFALDSLRVINKRYLSGYKLDSSDVLLSADWFAGFALGGYCKSISSDKRIEIIFHPEREEEYDFLRKSGQ